MSDVLFADIPTTAFVEPPSLEGVVDHKEHWDRRFLSLAKFISYWSKDPSTKVGAVIATNHHSHRVVSLGFNGFPKKIWDDPTVLEDRPRKYERVIHAEIAAIMNARGNVADCTLYTWWPGMSPCCSRCALMVIHANIKRVVGVSCLHPEEERWKEDKELALRLFSEAGVDVHLYPMTSI